MKPQAGGGILGRALLGILSAILLSLSLANIQEIWGVALPKEIDPDMP